MTTADLATVQKLGLLVWDIIAELSHRGEKTLDPDSAEAIELRETAYIATGKPGAGRDLAYTTLEWLNGMASFDRLKAASQAYAEDQNHVKTSG